MKAGVLGTVTGDFNAVSSYSETRNRDGFELTDTLEITGVFSLPAGGTGFSGHAVAEELRERRSVDTAYGSIETASEPAVQQRYTELAGKPGEFVVASSSRGAFAFEMIGADTNTRVERTAIDLDGFFAQVDPDRVWQAGFVEGTGGAETGVLHGSDLGQDDAVAGLLSDASLNQLGIEYEYDGREMKITVTASGYLEVYRPSDFETDAFLQYVNAEFKPFFAEA